MRELTTEEVDFVSGSGRFLQAGAQLGGIAGMVIVSPLALIMATFAVDSPRASAGTGVFFFEMMQGAGYAMGAGIGGSLGRIIDFFDYSETVTLNR
jgi:hypothetical protein